MKPVQKSSLMAKPSEVTKVFLLLPPCKAFWCNFGMFWCFPPTQHLAVAQLSHFWALLSQRQGHFFNHFIILGLLLFLIISDVPYTSVTLGNCQCLQFHPAAFCRHFTRYFLNPVLDFSTAASLHLTASSQPVCYCKTALHPTEKANQ